MEGAKGRGLEVLDWGVANATLEEVSPPVGYLGLASLCWPAVPGGAKLGSLWPTRHWRR